MQPGPDTFYKCPECKNLICNGSNLSGNNFGAKYYSDGKMIAPMLPKYPAVTECNKCGHLFWLNEENEEPLDGDELPVKFSFGKSLTGARSAKFLKDWQYDFLLSIKGFKTRKEERYLRIRYWWAVNDEIRDKEIRKNNYYEEKKCIDNMKELILILTDDIIELSKSDTNGNNAVEIDNKTFMIAELHRNLGNFEECMRTLKEIDKPELNYLMSLFEKECEKGNKLVFRIVRNEK